MRVVHLIKATRIGGAERHLLILLKALRERGVDAQLLVLVEPDNLMNELVIEATTHGIPLQRLVIHSNLNVVLINHLRARLRRLNPDVLHTHLIHADTFGIPAGRMAGVPIILTGRHNDDSFRSNPLISRANGTLWRMVDGGIAISEHVRRFTVDVEHAPPHKVQVVSYGIPHRPPDPAKIDDLRRDLRETLGLPDDALLMGMACRLTEQKGVSYALRAFAQLAADYPNVWLVIAGDGDLRDSLETETRRLGLRKRVFFLGWRDDVPAIMGGLDVFLMPSLWEGFGLVALEAMAKRLPIIASAVSAIPEVIAHGETGLLVPPRQVGHLAQAMRTLLDDRPLRAHMGLLAEDRLEQHFSVERMAEETIAVYQHYHR